MVKKATLIVGESKEVEVLDCPLKSENAEDHEHRAADVPEWCPNRDHTEDDTVEDSVRIWTPISDEEEQSMPHFLSLAKSILTCAQIQQGISETEAMENSCSGYAEQHVLDTLHDSGYSREVALRALMTKEIPPKIYERWTNMDMSLFEKGLSEQKKKFSTIRAKLLNHKTTMDIVEHYYEWKRSGKVKGEQTSRARVLLRRQDSASTAIIGSATDVGITTRSKNPNASKTGTPSKPTLLQRKNVYTGVKRKRKAARHTR